MKLIKIDVGSQEDGYTFRLNPITQSEISKINPEFNTASSVFMTFEIKEDFERLFGPIWKELIYMLTGLNDAQLKEFNKVEFYSPSNQKILLSRNPNKL